MIPAKKSAFRRLLNRTLGILARFSPGLSTIRPMLHRARGVKIGRGVCINNEVYLENEFPESIEIGHRVQISVRATIIAHTRGPGKVIIGDDAFIGPNTVIACAAGRVIKIGAGAVIGPGVVISRSVPPGVYLTVAEPQVVAHVGVPLPASRSIEVFRAGLRPLNSAAVKSSDDDSPSLAAS